MRFEGINAKVHALAGQLLKRKDYEALCMGEKPAGVIYTSNIHRIYNSLRHYLYEIRYREYLDAVYQLRACDYNKDFNLRGWLNLWKKQQRLPDKHNREVMTRLKGTEIDLANIIKVYRLKRYYHYPGARVLTHLVPVSHRLTPESLQRMAESESAYELTYEIKQGAYGNVFRNFSNPERDANRYIGRLYNREARQEANTLAVLTGFLFKMERETININAVQEGLLYKMPAKKIMEYLYL
jgi:V/A-type H+-transporting ATPase subunit C